jgi:hypothetical protein
MADALSICASIGGLISLAGELLQLLVVYGQGVHAFHKDFGDLVEEIKSFCGVLCLLEPVVRRFEATQKSDSTTLLGYSLHFKTNSP